MDGMSPDTAAFKTETNSAWCASIARRCVRDAVAGAMYHLGLWRLHGVSRATMLGKKAVCCLGLHRVLNDRDLQRSDSLRQIVIREETFARLLEYLRANFQLLSLEQLLHGKAGNTATPRPACLLTFDDGWVDNYTTAFPLLMKYDIPATIFLVTDLVSSGARFWVERVNEAWKDSRKRQAIKDCLLAAAQTAKDAAGLMEVVEYLKHMSTEQRQHLLDNFLAKDDEPPHNVDRTMTWDQAAEMSRAGVEFGAHTESHPLMTYESDEVASREIRHAKRMVEEKLGVKARSFAYPNGDWNDRVREHVQEAGYECAFTTCTGWHRLGDDLLAIRRILIHEGNVTDRLGRFSPAIFNMTLARGR